MTNHYPRTRKKYLPILQTLNFFSPKQRRNEEHGNTQKRDNWIHSRIEETYAHTFFHKMLATANRQSRRIADVEIVEQKCEKEARKGWNDVRKESDLRNDRKAANAEIISIIFLVVFQRLYFTFFHLIFSQNDLYIWHFQISSTLIRTWLYTPVSNCKK